MKIALIGSTGMLGQYCKDQLSKSHEIVTLDYPEFDLQDYQGIERQLRSSSAEFVINCAAYNAVDKIEEDDAEYKKAEVINGYAVGKIAKVTSEMDIPFLHFSSDYVFDGANERGYSTRDQAFPINKYGHTKLLGEHEVEGSTDKYYIIRISKLFGKPSKGEHGKKSFVDLMIGLSKTRDEIQVVDEEVSSPTYAADLVGQIEYIIDNNLPFGLYHITNAGSCTWYEFAKEIFSQRNIEVNVIPVSSEEFPRPAVRPEYSVLLNSRKLPLLRDWKDALKEYLDSVD